MKYIMVVLLLVLCACTFTATNDNGYSIIYDGVSVKSVPPTPTITPTPVTVRQIVVTVSGARLRATASTSSTVLRTIPINTVLTVNAEQRFGSFIWYHVSYQVNQLTRYEGWVRNDAINYTTPITINATPQYPTPTLEALPFVIPPEGIIGYTAPIEDNQFYFTTLTINDRFDILLSSPKWLLVCRLAYDNSCIESFFVRNVYGK